MDTLTLAVVSDLHIGGSRGKDLYPDVSRSETEQKDFDKLVDSNYLDIFIKFVKEKKINADYLLVPGDVSNTAQHSQFHLASSVISQIAKALKVKPNKILYVPGNHDLDWQMIRTPDPTNFYKELRYAALKDEKLIFEKIIKKSVEGHLLSEPCFSFWEYPNLIVVGYNSSWGDLPPVRPHHGEIKQEHLLKIDDFLSKKSWPLSKLRLFLAHHHPYNYSDPDPDYRDFSAMGNAENLINVLRKHKFDLIVHGHKHWPKFKIDYDDVIFPIAVFGSGSFSAQIYQGWQGKVDNQFHIIQIEGRDIKKNTIFGEIRSWTYLAAHGWRPSQTINGIEHISPFGSYYDPSEIKETLRVIFEKYLARESHILWSEILNEAKHLKNLHTNVRDRVISELKDEVSFTPHSIENDIIFLSEKKHR